jgi:hypothetical protein
LLRARVDVHYATWCGRKGKEQENIGTNRNKGEREGRGEKIKRILLGTTSERW